MRVAASNDRWSRRRTLATGCLGTAVLAVVLASCGGGSGSGSGSGLGAVSPAHALLASIDKTQGSSSAAIDVDVSVSGTPSFGGLGGAAAGTPVNLTVTGHGVFDFSAKNGDMTLNLPSIGAGKPATTLELRLVGGDLYLKSPALQSLDGGKPWVHVSASSYLQKEGQSTGPLGGFATGNPSDVLGLLQHLTGNVTTVGQEQVDGVQTTHYRATIDLTSPGTSTSSTVLSQQLAQALGLADVPVDVWLDSAGRLRQLKTSFDILGLTVGATEQMGSFGSPVTVTVPPASQTADGTGLLSQGKLGSLFS